MPVLAPGSSPLRVLHLSDLHMMPGQKSKQVVALRHRLAGPVRIRADGVVLIEAAQHQHPVVGQRRSRRVPAGVLLVRRIGRLGAFLHARIAAGAGAQAGVLSSGARLSGTIAEQAQSLGFLQQWIACRSVLARSIPRKTVVSALSYQ